VIDGSPLQALGRFLAGAVLSEGRICCASSLPSTSVEALALFRTTLLSFIGLLGWREALLFLSPIPSGDDIRMMPDAAGG